MEVAARVAQERVEAERDALRARVDELKLALAGERDRHDVDGKALMRARAQVEAVRALCASFDRSGGVMWPYEVLAAMDGSKPQGG